MNPQSNENMGMNLPTPLVEQAPAGAQPEAGPTMPEQIGPVVPERASGVAQVAPATIPLPTAPPMQTPVMPAAGQARAQQGIPPTAALSASDDNDLIEKEWVNKAKQIVERTREDPYKQTEELTHVKVDYMKKRYNKTLKLK